jgi:hypothetical protein
MAEGFMRMRSSKAAALATAALAWAVAGCGGGVAEGEVAVAPSLDASSPVSQWPDTADSASSSTSSDGSISIDAAASAPDASTAPGVDASVADATGAPADAAPVTMDAAPVDASVTVDAAPPPPPPPAPTCVDNPGTGYNCGDVHVIANGDPNTVYYCNGAGAAKAVNACGSAGCRHNPVGTADQCNSAPTAACGAGDLAGSDNGWCGSDGNVWYCYQTEWYIKANCAGRGCRIVSGSADQCN